MRLIHTKPFAKLVAEYQQDYDIGNAHVYLVKDASAIPTTTHSLSGELYLSSSGWLMLRVPNSLVRGAFDALDEEGVELPRNNAGMLNAHITVMSPDDLKKIGGEDKTISDRGHHYRYTLGPVQAVAPEGQEEFSKVWYIRVSSLDLQDLRKSHGLSPRPAENGHDFHITIAYRRKKVLRNNDIAKEASLPAIAGVHHLISGRHEEAAPEVPSPEQQLLDDDSAVNQISSLPTELFPRVKRKRRISPPVIAQVIASKEGEYNGLREMWKEDGSTKAEISGTEAKDYTGEEKEAEFSAFPGVIDTIIDYYAVKYGTVATSPTREKYGQQYWELLKQAGPYSYLKKKIHNVYGKLEDRYGPTMAKVIVGSGAAGIPVPIPGASLMTAAPALAAGEALRAFNGPPDHDKHDPAYQDAMKRREKLKDLFRIGAPTAGAAALGGLLFSPTNTRVPIQVTKFPGQEKPDVIRGLIGKNEPASTIERTGEGYLSAGSSDQSRTHIDANNIPDLTSKIKGKLNPGQNLGVLELGGHGHYTHQDVGNAQGVLDKISPKTVSQASDYFKSIPWGKDPNLYMYGCNTGLCAPFDKGKPNNDWPKALSDNTGINVWGASGFTKDVHDAQKDVDVHSTMRGGADHPIERGVNNLPGEDYSFTKYSPGKDPEQIITQDKDTASKQTFGTTSNTRLNEALYNVGQPAGILGSIAAPLIPDKKWAKRTAIGASGLAAPMAINEILTRLQETNAQHQMGLGSGTLDYLKNQGKALPYAALAALPLLSYGGANLLGRWDKKHDKVHHK